MSAYAEACHNRALMHARTGRYLEAIQLDRRALQITPAYDQARVTLAEWEKRKDMYTEGTVGADVSPPAPPQSPADSPAGMLKKAGTP